MIKEKNEIKAVIFDVGGVIYIGKMQAHDYLYEKFGLSRKFWFESIGEVFNNLVKGRIGAERGLAIMSKNLNMDKEKLRKSWIGAFKKRFQLNKPLLKLIKKLRENYKTAILSDQWFIPYNLLLKKPILREFDATIFSHHVGTRKPDVRIYWMIIRKLKLKASECIFIDDRDWNLKPAESLGMKTILFQNNKQLVKDLKKLNIKI